MQGFLCNLAEELYSSYGDDISSLNIILPNNRARLFFTDALSQIVGKPIWQPSFLSIDEIMGQVSGMSVSDSIPVIAQLYKVYHEHYKDENFDTFYYWGEMLLADFDSIDKYLIDAKMLFANVSELKEIESDLSFLTPEQRQVITHFWNTFNAERAWSAEQEEFYKIWGKLYDIYTKFKTKLEADSMAYQGMMYRRAVENLVADKGTVFFEGKRFIIAGFNALSECEKKLFRYLQDKCKAEFYWDYDEYYYKDSYQEAGLFMRDNLRLFPGKKSLGEVDNFVKEKQISVVSVPSDALQCRYVGDYLKGLDVVDKNTAVVLTDENLLLPVIYSVPESVENINITMGYPLIQTTAYSFVERLLAAQKHRKQKSKFYYNDVQGLLMHPYVIKAQGEVAQSLKVKFEKRAYSYIDAKELIECGGLIARVFRPVDTWEDIADYLVGILSYISEDEDTENIEFFSLIIEHIYKITNSVKNIDVEFTRDIYVSLLRRTLQKIRVPYSGEPLLGLQIMGILETRNLDFENVIILSMNDDNFPGNRISGSSFIPHNLRMAYGLPTPTHHQGVYAYYFYRLLQRAKNVQLVYSSQSDDKKTGEKSRYIYQLAYESKHDIKYIDFDLDVNLKANKQIEIKKDEYIIEKLRAYCNSDWKFISPTAFSSYVQCSLKFYFRYIAQLKKVDELSEEIDNPTFGLILHTAMELLYKDIVGDIKIKAKALIGSQKVESCVVDAINEHYFKGNSMPITDWAGNVLLVYDIVIKYINQCILPYDSEHEEFMIEDREHQHLIPLQMDFQGERVDVQIGGTIDRVDSLSGELLRVVDYKTGTMHKQFSRLEDLFISKADSSTSAVLQTMIYSMVLNRETKKDVQPALYYVRMMNDKNYSPLLVDKGKKQYVLKYSEYKADFEGLLLDKIQTLFDASVNFTQCEDEKCCEWCDYKLICRR